MKKRPAQHADESAIEFLSRVVSWCAYETTSLLDDLKSVEAVLDFFDLWSDYDTDFWSGILECIADGDSPAKARAFVRKYRLPKSWSADIDYAMECRETANA